MRGRKKRCYSRTLQKASLFSMAMMSIVLLAGASAFIQTPALVLGTELNANGSLEYLCLGNGCESLPDFHWAD